MDPRSGSTRPGEKNLYTPVYMSFSFTEQIVPAYSDQEVSLNSEY